MPSDAEMPHKPDTLQNSSKDEGLKNSLRHFYHSQPFYTTVIIVIITIIVLWWLNSTIEMIYDPNAPPY